ncbi:hypothetical protein VIGAN_06062600 [Vigna angularis var. angularis]|uniref:Uncharacterized protein n=1 Tax=Vigna angularis var. angularis TaxID=157739 RepID=A0A0S3S9S7_PHAAN|nr:hypothetical protein VIGAN_06062600 [Vigna angularis var. angularis]
MSESHFADQEQYFFYLPLFIFSNLFLSFVFFNFFLPLSSVIGFRKSTCTYLPPPFLGPKCRAEAESKVTLESK